MVLQCDALHLSHSLGKRLRQIARAQEAGDYSIVVKVNTAFTSTLRACARPSLNGQAGTWITGEMQLAYEAWHLLGHVHSIETWVHGELVGGLYGVSLGHMFFGESMFSRTTDASKTRGCLDRLPDAHRALTHLGCRPDTTTTIYRPCPTAHVDA